MAEYEVHVWSRKYPERMTAHFVDASRAIYILKGRTNAGEVLVYDKDGEIVGRRWKIEPSQREDKRRKYGWLFYSDEIKAGNNNGAI